MAKIRQQEQHQRTGQRLVAGLAGRGGWSRGPLVSLSKTTIECRRESAPEQDNRDGIPALSQAMPVSLSSRASSAYLDIQSFSSSSLSSLKSRTQFEQLFDIFPESDSESPVPNFFTRFSLEEPSLLLAESSCLSTTSLEIPIPLPRHGSTCLYTVPPPPTLAMSLRKYASTESDGSSPAAQPRSLASRLLHFGFGHSGHSDQGSSSQGSEHSSSHASDDEHHQKDDTSLQSDDSQTASSSKYLLTPSAMAVSTAHRHMDGTAAPHGSSSDVSPASEDDTARATHEAMNTPITIPHSSTAPATHGHARPPIQLLGRSDDTSKVMTAAIASELRSLLPVQQRLAKSWRLVYSMDQHGISFNTMLALCAREGAMLLAVKDTKGKVFGAFLNEPLRLSPTFYGQGSCFLWKAYKSSPQSRRKDAVKNFKYTGENEYFVLCDPDFVAVGGGRGKFGLWIKSDFLHGYSARCPTFNNEPLGLDPSHPKNSEPDAQQEFVVGHFEIWAFNA